MKITKIGAAIFALSLIAANAQVLPANAAKSGQKCSKSGVTTGSGAKKLTCSKKGKKLVWVKTPEPALGSASQPVPMGTYFTVGGIEYAITGVNANADEVICKGNGFNKGCTVDLNLGSIVDPKSETSWLTVQFTARNKTGAIAKPGGIDRNFFLVLSNGQLLENELFVSFPTNLFEVQVVPSGSGTGDVAFPLPKTGNPTSQLMVLRDSSNLFKPVDYYFQVRW